MTRRKLVDGLILMVVFVVGAYVFYGMVITRELAAVR